MSDAYKGLTIRIGADTTRLQDAMRASSRAADEARKHMRLLENAAKLDPTSVKAVQLQFKELAGQSSAYSKTLHTLKTALAQLDAEGIGKIYSGTKNAAYEAEKAKEAYSGIVAEIKRYKNALASKYDAGFDIAKPSTDPFKGLDKNADAVKAKMRELGATEKEVAEYARMVGVYFKRMDEYSVASKVREFGELKARIASTEAQAESARRKLVELSATNCTAALNAEFMRGEQRIKEYAAAGDSARKSLSLLSDSFKNNPSVEIAVARMRALSDAINASENRARELSSQLATLKAGGFDRVAAKSKDLAGDLLRAKEKAEALRAEFDRMESSGPFKQTSAELSRMRAKLAEAEAEVQQLGNAAKYADKQMEFAKAKAELAELRAQMGSTKGKFEEMRAMAQNLGWSMSATLSAGASMFAHSAVSAAEEVDAAYRDMRKTVQGSEEQFEKLKQAAIDYSRTHVTAPETILEIEAMGGQLGVATSKLEAFATVVSNLDIATDLDADTAAQQLGQLSGILNDMSQDDFAKYGDALTRLGNNNATLESKISDVMLRISSMGTITGFTTPQLLAWSTAVAATGQGCEAAGTAISKTMSDIEGAVGAGGKKLEAFAKVAGMSASDFANAWNNDPSSAMKAFIDGLNGVEASGGSADATLGQLGITSVRQKQAILGLMQTIGGLNDNLTMAGDAWNGVSDEWGDAGDAAWEAERKAEGFSGAIQLLRNNFEAFGVEVGSSVQPLLEGLAQGLAVLTQAWSDAPESVKVLTDVLIALFAALGPGLVAVTAITNGFKTLKDSVKSTAAWKAAQAAMEATAVSAEHVSTKMKLAAAASELTRMALAKLPWALAAMLVAELAMKLVDYARSCETARQATEGTRAALDAIKGGAEQAGASYAQSAETVISAANDAIDSQKELASSVTGTFNELNANSSMVSDYVATIKELAGNCDDSAEKQAKLRAAVAGYNEITGDTVRITDIASGTLSKSTSEIEANSDAWKENAKAQALQQAYADALKQQAENKAAMIGVDATLASQEKGLGLYVGDFAVFATKAGVATHDLEAKKKQLEEQDQANAEMTEYLANEVASANAALEANKQTTDGAATSAQSYAAMLGMTSDEFTSFTESVVKAIDGSSGLSDFFSMTGMSVDEFAFSLQSAGIDASELGSQIDAMKDKVQNAFDAIEAQGAVTAEEMIANLQNNIDVTNEWSSNLQQLYARAGDGAGRSLVDSIAAKGPEYAATVAALLSADDATWAELVAKWSESGASAVNGAASSMNATMPQLEAAKQGAVDAMTTSSADGAQAFAGLVEGVDYAIDGVSSKQGAASDAAGGIANATQDQIDNMKDTSWQIGAATGSNYAAGIWAKTGEAGRAAGDVAMAAANSFGQYSDYAWQWGAHMGSNFAAGLWSKTGEASRAAAAVAQAGADNLKHTIAKKGPLRNGGKGEKPWGQHMVQNYITGIESQIPALNATMARVASAAAGYMERAGGSAALAGGAAHTTVSAPQPVVNVKVQPQRAANQPSSEEVAQMVIDALPGIIAEYTPVMGEKDFGRKVRKAVSYA